MTRKFHTEKHLKKRHFIEHDQMHSKKKMTVLQPAEKPVIDEKTEQANQLVEPTKQTADVKATPIADVAPKPSVMPQQIFQFTRRKSAFEKLKDKFHQLMGHFKS